MLCSKSLDCAAATKLFLEGRESFESFQPLSRERGIPVIDLGVSKSSGPLLRPPKNHQFLVHVGVVLFLESMI